GGWGAPRSRPLRGGDEGRPVWPATCDSPLLREVSRRLENETAGAFWISFILVKLLQRICHFPLCLIARIWFQTCQHIPSATLPAQRLSLVD
ncbi:unnamed protein product, partial [Gulo gulo]